MQEKPQERWQDCLTAWFVVLEKARLADDYERAALAIRQLRRLGVEVKFTRPKGRKARSRII